MNPKIRITADGFRPLKNNVFVCEPTAQLVSVPVYLHGALLLHEALKDSGELTPALNLPEVAPIGRDIYALVQKHMIERLPNWRELLPPEVVEQIDQMMLDSEQPEE